MVLAIGLVGLDRVAAETEILGPRFAVGPTAHAGTERLKADDLGGPGFLLDRRSPLRQAEAVDLADDRVFGDPQPVPDHPGSQSFVPKGDKGADA